MSLIRDVYIRGCVVMALSSVCFSAMAALVRYAREVDAFKTSLFRFTVGMALFGAAAMAGKIRLRFNFSRLLFVRGFLGGLAVFLFFLSIREIGVARGTVISYSYPIFAVLGGILILRERVRLWQWGVVLLSLFGTYLIATDKKGFFWDFSAKDLIPNDFSNFGIYDGLAIAGAAATGLALVTVKKLRETDSVTAIVFAQMVVGFWIVALPANLMPVHLDLWGGLVLVMIGLIAALGQYLMTDASHTLPISTGALIGLLTPVLNIPIGIMFFDEKVSVKGLIGILIVLVSCTVVAMARGEKDPGSPPCPLPDEAQNLEESKG